MNMTDIQDLGAALERYFDLMYDCDVANFDRVFAPSAQLHGFREGAMSCWPAVTPTCCPPPVSLMRLKCTSCAGGVLCRRTGAMLPNQHIPACP
jgi:hypothetical protein